MGLGDKGVDGQGQRSGTAGVVRMHQREGLASGRVVAYAVGG